MPSFNVEFEVFCGTCGDGLCSQSEGRNSRNRNAPQVEVEACKTCLERATKPLEADVSESKSRIEELEREVEELKQQSLADVNLPQGKSRAKAQMRVG